MAKVFEIKSERSLRRHRTNGAKFKADSTGSATPAEVGATITYERARRIIQNGGEWNGLDWVVLAVYDEDTKATASDGITDPLLFACRKEQAKACIWFEGGGWPTSNLTRLAALAGLALGDKAGAYYPSRKKAERALAHYAKLHWKGGRTWLPDGQYKVVDL